MGIIVFSIGSLNVYLYGLIASVAILMGMIITKGNLYLRQEAFSRVVDILVFSIPMSLFCSRLFYVILNWSFYRNDWWEIFLLHHGGLSVYGAFTGFVLTVFFYTYLHNLQFLYWLDLLVPALVLGLAIIQFGNFISQATVGVPVTGSALSNSKIVEYIEFAFRPSGFQQYEYFRPVALYQAFWQLFVFGCVCVLSVLQIYSRMIRTGNIFLWSMVLLCVGRFCLGFYYLTTNPGSELHLGQVISLLGAILCGGLIAMRMFLPHHHYAKRIFRS